RARFAAADEFLRMYCGPVFEGLTGPGRREQALVGARRAPRSEIKRFLIRLVDIHDGAVSDLRLLLSSGGGPVGKEFSVSRRRIAARIDQKVSRIDGVLRAEFERLRITAHHP